MLQQRCRVVLNQTSGNINKHLVLGPSTPGVALSPPFWIVDHHGCFLNWGESLLPESIEQPAKAGHRGLSPPPSRLFLWFAFLSHLFGKGGVLLRVGFATRAFSMGPVPPPPPPLFPTRKSTRDQLRRPWARPSRCRAHRRTQSPPQTSRLRWRYRHSIRCIRQLVCSAEASHWLFPLQDTECLASPNVQGLHTTQMAVDCSDLWKDIGPTCSLRTRGTTLPLRHPPLS